MLYDPNDLEQYAPVWDWSPGLYLHLTLDPARGVEQGPRQVYVPGAVHARSSWLELELRECTAPVFSAARLCDMAAVKRIAIDKHGFAGWRMWDLQLSEHHLHPLADKGKLSRRYGNLARAILGWKTDPAVRASCLSQTFTTTVVASADECWVELPRLEDEQDFLPSILQTLGELLGGIISTWDFELPFHSSFNNMQLAMREGMLSIKDRRLRVALLIGNDALHKPTQHWKWMQRELQNQPETDVRPGPLPELLQLRVVPPTAYQEVRTFNEHLGLSPLHLLAHEILRVIHTLRVVRRWTFTVPQIERWEGHTRLANVVEDLTLRKQFLCLDTVSECFVFIPYPWSSKS